MVLENYKILYRNAIKFISYAYYYVRMYIPTCMSQEGMELYVYNSLLVTRNGMLVT